MWFIFELVFVPDSIVEKCATNYICDILDQLTQITKNSHHWNEDFSALHVCPAISCNNIGRKRPNYVTELRVEPAYGCKESFLKMSGVPWNSEMLNFY